MAEKTTAAPAAATPKKKKGWLIALIIFIIVLASFVGWMVYDHHKTLENIKTLVQAEADKYTDKEAALSILVDLANEVLMSRTERKTAKDYAKANKVSYEQAVTDRAIALAHSMGYISNTPA